jgi:glycosyltransferase involved in cell wall biosynthesis
MGTAVIIPALNEAVHIADLVRDILDMDIALVIVVDNGSTDETAARAAEAGALVVSEDQRGYGFACHAGAQQAVALGADTLVFMDGDYSCLPAEIPDLVAPIQAGRANLVLGSRVLGHIQPGAMPGHQRFGNWLSAGLMQVLYGIQVTDLGPFRAIQSRALERLNMAQMTFGWPTEMTVKSARTGLEIQEVPVSWHKRRSGKSKVSGTLRGSVLAAYYILGVTLRYALYKPDPMIDEGDI